MATLSQVSTQIHALVSKERAEKDFSFVVGLNEVIFNASTKVLTIIDHGRKVMVYNLKTRKGSTTLNAYGYDIVVSVIKGIMQEHKFTA
ncbi:hypothetical protein D3C87_1222660 [compost metagenome]